MIDHVVIFVRDQMDDAVARYRRLGFCMTPRGHHIYGQISHMAVLGHDYLELVGVPPGRPDRNDLMRYQIGLNALSLSCEDVEQVYAQLIEAGVPIEPPLELSRRMSLSAGPREVSYRVARLARGTLAAGRLMFCQHHTRDLVWRDEWRTHPNGAIALAGITICSATPPAPGDLFAQMFGWPAVRPIRGGLRLAAAMVSIDVVTPDEVVRRYGAGAPAPGGRQDYMVGITLRTRSVEQAAAALREGNVLFDQRDSQLLVPASQGMGMALEFVD